MKPLLPLSKSIYNLASKSATGTTGVCSNVCSVLITSSRTHLGYIPPQGRQGRQPTNINKFQREIRRVNIQPVKKATFMFDPIREDFQSIRNFMFYFNNPKILETNLKVVVKTDIVDDRREPMIKLELNDGRDLEIKTGHLTELDIVRVVNFYTLPLVTEEKAALETKSSKAPAGGGKKGRK